MSSITDSATSGFKDVFGGLPKSIARSLLHNKYPNDFEYYMCSLELVEIDGENEKTVDLLVFPVMPQNLQIQNDHITNITKTSSGVVILENNTFVPLDISIQGNFGRKIRALLGRTLISIDKLSFRKGSQVAKKPNEFSRTVKTGYGTMKVLEDIYNRSAGLTSDGKMYRLFFYNFAFNSHWLVQPLKLGISQSLDSSNMIWNYNLSLKAVAPAEQVVNAAIFKKSMASLMAIDQLQKTGTKAIDFAKNQAVSLGGATTQAITSTLSSLF